MTTLVNIRCRSLSLSISREACGAQVTRAYAPAVCRSCEVGAAHARGERPLCWAAPRPSHKRKIPTFAGLAESGRTARSWRAA